MKTDLNPMTRAPADPPRQVHVESPQFPIRADLDRVAAVTAATIADPACGPADIYRTAELGRRSWALTGTRLAPSRLGGAALIPPRYPWPSVQGATGAGFAPASSSAAKAATFGSTRSGACRLH